MVLRLGQRVPDIVLFDSEGREGTLAEFTKTSPVAIAFFPFAFSGTCDREMCAFRDGVLNLSPSRGAIIGVSVDSVFTLKVFSQTYGLQFPLLSDFNKKVSRAYGVLQEQWNAYRYKGVSKRAVFVVDMKGILRYRWMTDDPGTEPPYGEIEDVLKKFG